MNTALEKLLISELRIVVYEAADAGSKPAKADSFVPQLLSDDRITQAMTVNEELRNLGYTLKPADILRLAASRSMTGFAQHFRSLMPSVDAPPMYPDFPEQVMKMEEAEFRMHQMIHYLWRSAGAGFRMSGRLKRAGAMTLFWKPKCWN